MAVMDLEHIKNRVLRDGGARPNRFKIRLSFPPSLLQEEPYQQDLEYQCESTVFPGKSIHTADYGTITGPSRKIPYQQTYMDATASFRMSVDHAELKRFHLWLDLVVDANNNFGYYNDICGTMEVWQLGVDGKETSGYRLINVYPLNIQDVSVSMASVDSISSFNVTFHYHRWERI